MEFVTSAFAWLMSGHTGLTGYEYLLNFLFAFLGASVTVFARGSDVKFPKRTRTGWEPGTLGIYIVGVSCALAVGHRIPVPFIVAMLSPVVVPTLLTSTAPAVLKALNPALLAVLETWAGKLRQKGGEDR